MSAEFFPPANRTAQWFEDDLGGARMDVKVGCLHTTEGTSWPSYAGGAVAPNLTAKPVMSGRRLQWRQHFRLNTSSRALVNRAGGVETNTLNVVQVELVGTCDPAHREHFGKQLAGVDYVFWPDAPDWALEGLADFMRWWSPLARRGRLGLTVSFLWRPLWFLGHAGPAYLAWRRARREATSAS